MDPTGTDSPRKRIVFVEDDPDNLETMSMLMAERYAVFGYPSAVEALRAIEEVKPNVLVLDIGMEPVDGMQCLSAIRSIPAYRKIPALALTAFAHEIERQRFLAAGFEHVIVKPIVDYGRFFATIDGLLDLDLSAPVPASTAGRSRTTDGHAP
ncbi:MAG: response regulator [Candidatus Binatia bacterium]